MRSPEQQIQAALGNARFQLASHSLKDTGKWFTSYEIDLPSAFQHGLPPAWRFCLLSNLPNAPSTTDIEEITSEALNIIARHGSSDKSVPLIILSDSPAFRVNDRLPKSQPNIFFLDQSDLPGRGQTSGPPRSAPLLLTIRRKLSTEASARLLSPYVPNQPANNWRFFGRQDEIKKILYSPENFMVIGARRMGKTSLLEHLVSQFETMQRRPFYINVQDCLNEREVSNRILELVALRDYAAMIRRRNMFPDRMLHAILRRMVAQSGQKGVILLLDELGNVVSKSSSEEGWKIIGVLRTFAQSGQLRIIASGFQEFLLRQQADYSGPWVNFFSSIRLSGMDRKDLEDFVISPLSNWVNIPHPQALLNLVVENVGQHPLALQYFCQALFVSVLQPSFTDVFEAAKKIIGSELLRHFSDPVDDIFYSIPYPVVKYVYLRLCHETAVVKKPIHELVIDDDAVSGVLRRAGVESTTMARRNLLQHLEFRGLTQTEKDNRGRQRVITPIVYRVISESEKSVLSYIEKLKREIETDFTEWGLKKLNAS
jgi:AAA domain